MLPRHTFPVDKEKKIRKERGKKEKNNKVLYEGIV